MQAESHSVVPLQSVPRTSAPDDELVPTVVTLQSISCCAALSQGFPTHPLQTRQAKEATETKRPVTGAESRQNLKRKRVVTARVAGR